MTSSLPAARCPLPTPAMTVLQSCAMMTTGNKWLVFLACLTGLIPWQCHSLSVQAAEARSHPQQQNARGHCHSSTIYTYYEPIPMDLRTTGMTQEDDDQLLLFWKEQWTSAGWNAVVLGVDTVVTCEEYSVLEELLSNELHLDPWGRVVFHRWMAMAAVGGGWYADYDVFPLGLSDFVPPVALPNNGRMTVHDILSPTLASGTAEQWRDTLLSLLDNAKANMSPFVADGQWTFWTDSLGINNLVKDHGKQPPAPLTAKRVLVPYGRNDLKDCQARSIRGRWVVHMSPKVFQMAPHLSPLERHPRYRKQEAQRWLQRWNNTCLANNQTQTRR